MFISTKIKITITSICISMLLAVMSIGAWAATSQKSGVGGTITFTPFDVSIEIVGAIYGNNGINDPSNQEFITFTDSVNYDDTNGSTWSIASLTGIEFVEEESIYICIAVRNIGNNSVYISPTNNPTPPTNTQIAYKMHETTSSQSLTTLNITTATTGYHAVATSCNYSDLIKNTSATAIQKNDVYYFEMVYTVIDWYSSIDETSIEFAITMQSYQIT